MIMNLHIGPLASWVVYARKSYYLSWSVHGGYLHFGSKGWPEVKSNLW